MLCCEKKEGLGQEIGVKYYKQLANVYKSCILHPITFLSFALGVAKLVNLQAN